MSSTNGDEYEGKGVGHSRPSAAVASSTFVLQGFVLPSTPLRLKEGYAKDNWRRWKQLWESYEVVSGLKTQHRDYRFATFVMCVGRGALDLYDAIQFEPGKIGKT